MITQITGHKLINEWLDKRVYYLFTLSHVARIIIGKYKIGISIWTENLENGHFRITTYIGHRNTF